MEIQGIELTDEHIGKKVVYRTVVDEEHGIISSWNKSFVFVRYYSNIIDGYLKPQPQSTNSDDLSWD